MTAFLAFIVFQLKLEFLYIENLIRIKGLHSHQVRKQLKLAKLNEFFWRKKR